MTHMVTPTHDTAHYSCSVSTDVYVRGTVDVDCANGVSWPVATILCAREFFFSFLFSRREQRGCVVGLAVREPVWPSGKALSW